MKLPVQKNIIYIASLVILFGIIVFSSWADLFYEQELSLYDLRYRLRPRHEVSQSIVIIEIAEDTLTSLNTWPIKRDVYAQLIDILDSWGVRQIIFDILFSEKTDDDAVLADAMVRAGKAYLPYVLGKTEQGGYRYLSSVENTLLPAATGSGFINIAVDPDGKIRRVPLVLRDGQQHYMHLILRAFIDREKIPAADVRERGDWLYVGKKRIPLYRNNFLIDFAGKWKDTFKHVSFLDVLLSYRNILEGQEPIVDPAMFKDAICLIGLTAAGTSDVHSTPLETLYPLVGVGANVYNSLLTGQFVRRVSPAINLLLCLFLSGMILGFIKKGTIFNGTVITAASLAAYTAGAFASFYFYDLWVNIVVPVGAGIVIYMVHLFSKLFEEVHFRALVEKDFSLAQQIQKSFLPYIPEKIFDLNVKAEMIAARQVGGDFYDSQQISGKCTAFLLGDVSGKGVGAALVMVKVMTLFRIFSREDPTAAMVLARLNRELKKGMTTSLFATAVYLVYNHTESSMTISSAGHLPAVLVDRAGTKRIDFEEGLPLGVLPEALFEEKRLAMSPGDVLVLYTDGVIETRDSRGKEFGIERLQQVVYEHREATAGEIVEAVKKAVFSFSRDPLNLFDDFTVMAIKKL